MLAAIAVALLGLILLMSREHATVAPARPTIDTEPPVSKSSRTPTSMTAPHKAEEQEKERPATNSRTESVAAPSSTSSPAATLPPPTVRDETVSTASVRTDPMLGGPAPDGSLVLTIEALELTWVVVQIDNGSPEEALMRPGERVQWKSSDRFTLTLGNAGGVRVELNGKEQGPFGPSGKVARDIVLKRS